MSPENANRFNHLSTVTESLRPLTPSDIDTPLMRTQLIEAGLSFSLSETERRSLAESRFRDLESGRGVGMVAVLGREKAEMLLRWCSERSKGGPKLKNKGVVTEGSEGRGLRQLAADLIQLVSRPEPTLADIDKFCFRTNQRVMKGLLWDSRDNKEASGVIRQAFADIPEPELTFSSVPSGSVAELWSFLTAHN